MKILATQLTIKMKKLSIVQNYPKASVSDIEEFEKNNKLRIPCDLKWFWVSQNIFVSDEKYFVKNEKSYEVHHFYPFSEDAEASINFVYEALSGFFENSYLPFADDSGGWQYVVSIQEQNYGKVYLCRMDEVLENALTLLTDSFEDFINALQVGEEII